MFDIKFFKSRDVKDPVRGTAQAAGIDFFVPVFNEAFITDFIAKNPVYADKFNIANMRAAKEITVLPGMRVLIPSGIHTYFEPKASALIAANKSGVSTKKGLRFTCQVVDSDYTGEIHIGVANDSDRAVTISEGEKLIQFIHTPVYLSPLVSVEQTEFYNLHMGTERGDNWQGSTDKQ